MKDKHTRQLKNEKIKNTYKSLIKYFLSSSRIRTWSKKGTIKKFKRWEKKFRNFEKRARRKTEYGHQRWTWSGGSIRDHEAFIARIRIRTQQLIRIDKIRKVSFLLQGKIAKSCNLGGTVERPITGQGYITRAKIQSICEAYAAPNVWLICNWDAKNDN
jgi:hypothetical protein